MEINEPMATIMAPFLDYKRIITLSTQMTNKSLQMLNENE